MAVSSKNLRNQAPNEGAKGHFKGDKRPCSPPYAELGIRQAKCKRFSSAFMFVNCIPDLLAQIQKVGLQAFGDSKHFGHLTTLLGFLLCCAAEMEKGGCSGVL